MRKHVATYKLHEYREKMLLDSRKLSTVNPDHTEGLGFCYVWPLPAAIYGLGLLPITFTYQFSYQEYTYQDSQTQSAKAGFPVQLSKF